LTTSALNGIIGLSPLLQRVLLSGLNGVTNETLATLFRTSLSIKVLNVSRCAFITGDALVTSRHPGLVELYASGIDGLDGAVLADIGRSFPALAKLDISDNETVTDTAIRSFVKPMGSHSEQRSTALRYFNISRCTRLTNAALCEMAGSMPLLECLEAADIGFRVHDHGFAALLRTTPRLRKLGKSPSKAFFAFEVRIRR
jgi:F-box/leucine-rich repeat protein 2/20